MIFHFIICVLATLTSILLLIFAAFAFGQRKNISNLLLSLFLLSNAVFLIDFIGGLVQFLLNISIPGTGAIGIIFGYLFGPLLYLFTQSLTQKGFTFKSRYLGHFIPFLLSGPTLIILTQAPLSYHFFTLITHIFIYLFLCIFSIRNYVHLWDTNETNEYQTNLNWLRYVVGGFMVMWGVDLIGIILYQITPENVILGALATLTSILINFIFAIIIFYMALKQPKFLYKLGEQIKYKSSKLTEKEKASILQKLEALFLQERPYLNPTLSMKDVSSLIHVPVKYISQVINEYLDKNFYDFVNEYRIEEAKSQLLKYNELTILEILYSSGFNTKSAFNSAFKKHTGLTPTEFRNGVLKVS